MEKNYNKNLGDKGEFEATKYLEMLDYTIIARNYITINGEIDIIAKDKNEYVFIEVKTRTSKEYGVPVEAINKHKKSHILRASEYYIYKNGLNSEFIRFDIIEVYINQKNKFINHIKNVFF